MAQRRRPKIEEKDLQGLKYFRLITPLLERLQDCATERDRAGNRQLFFDQYVSLLLLYFFNPIVTSLRALQQASLLEKVQKRLDCLRTSLGSLSEAARIFDPALLREILGELAAKATPVVTGREAEALRQLTAVDGSLLPALPKMAWALWQDLTHRAAKMHVAFDVFRCIPVDATVTAGNASERTQLLAMLRPCVLYVFDRGYACYEFFQMILDAGASFVGRLQDNAAYRVIEQRTLTAAAKAAGVVRDLVVDKLGSDRHKNVLKQPVRVLLVDIGLKNTDGTPDLLVLATNRLDLDAELVATAYRYRWSVELFFRWFKCVLGCRHLISTSQNGVTIQVYIALIASLLIALWTGRKPTKRTWEMLQFYFTGWASEEELMAHLASLKKETV
jgi:hypothetical protein